MSGVPRPPAVPHLVARLDATSASGMAHAIRVNALLQELPRPIRLTVIGQGEALGRFFPDAVRGESGQPWEAGLETLRPDLLLIDLPRAEEVQWEVLGAAYRGKTVLIDDWGGRVDADLIINGTVLDRYHRYPVAHAGARILAGSRYALLRAAFHRQRWRAPDAENLVVVVGGGERAAEWACFLARHTPWPDLRATLVVGAAFPKLPELAEILKSSPRRRGDIELCVDLPGERLASLLAGASLALTTGGMIVYECLALGTPLVFFPQLPDLLPEAEWFAAREVGLSLGPAGFDAAALAAALGSLLEHAGAREAMSRRQRRLIDGQGARRAAAAVAALLADPAGRSRP